MPRAAAPAGDPAGYLGRDGWVPLYCAHHPVTGDQLLSTVAAEARSLGYENNVLLGYLVGRPRLTESLRPLRSPIPWAQQFGLSSDVGGLPLPSGAVDQPLPGDAVRSRALRVSGCVVWPAATVSRVEVLIDGVPRGRARLAVPRADWAGRLPTDQHPAVCGFEAVLPPDELPEGDRPFHVSAVAESRDGAKYAVPGVEVDPEPAPAYADNVAPAVRRGASPVPTGTGTRALAFAHHLGVGGAQRYMVELLARLGERRGFSCTVVAPEDGEHRSALEESGHEVRIVPGLDRLHADEYEAHQAELAELAVEGGYDLVLANALDTFPGVDLADRMGLPSVWALHESFDLDVWWTQTKGSEGAGSYARGRSAAALRSASALVFATEATARLYRPHADPARFEISPYGLELDEIARRRRELDRAAERSRLGLSPDADVVLCMASVERRKGQALLARAFAEVADAHPRALLALVGDQGGAYSQAVHSFVAARGLEERVRIVPMTSDPYGWHEVADVFALASDVESSPFAVLEAMAFGTPALACRVFGLPELVVEGETGLLCEPSDVGGLADCLDRLLAMDSSERAAMGRAAERRVREQHDPVEHADRVWELLKRVQDPASSRASTAAAAGVKGSGQGPAGSVQDASANSSPSSTSSE
jgi:glycosyltransferase involved in cell wall biosynthesis